MLLASFGLGLTCEHRITSDRIDGKLIVPHDSGTGEWLVPAKAFCNPLSLSCMSTRDYITHRIAQVHRDYYEVNHRALAFVLYSFVFFLFYFISILTTHDGVFF